MAKNRTETEKLAGLQKRLANLKRDAGPGRPKGQRNFATLYKDALLKLATLNKKTPEDLEDEILSKGLLNARSGDYRFYKDLLDRLHGTPTNNSSIDVTTNGESINDSKVEWIIRDYRKKDDNQKDVCS